MARKRDEDEEEHCKQVKREGFRVEERQGALVEDQQAVPKKKRRKRVQGSSPEGSKGSQNLNSKSSKKGQDVSPQRSIQGQELTDAKQNNEVTPKVSMDEKKKKRDQWGQVLDDADIAHDTSNNGMDVGMLDNGDKVSKDEKKKRKRKIRDRWGQVLDDADSTHDTLNNGMDIGMLDNGDKVSKDEKKKRKRKIRDRWGQVLDDADYTSNDGMEGGMLEDADKVSMDVKDEKKKEKKKKRDRWGQVLDDLDITHDTSNNGIEGGMLDDADKVSMDVKDEKKKKKKKKRDQWVLDDVDTTRDTSNDDMEGGKLDDADNAQDAAYEHMDGAIKVSLDVKDEKKKKKKKKRDRWGQVLDHADITRDTSNNGMEGDMLDDANNAQDAEYEDMDGAVIEHDSHSSEYDNKTVCAGGLPYDTTEEDILECFRECGSVVRVLCMKFADTQRFKGLAFITFETEAAASKALSLDGVNMGGRHIKIERFRAGGKVLRAPPRREAGSLSVYVGNLDWGVQKIDIKRFFKGCDIDNVRLAVNKNTGDFRGYGHVDFSDEKSLEKAIKMDQKWLLGRPVKVCYAVPKGFRGESG